MWWTNKKNAERWLHESYIKNEADVLLTAKKLIIPAIEGVRHFHITTLGRISPFIYSITPLPEKLPEKWMKELVMDFEAIKKLYNLFIENDNIFIKHQLDISFDYLNLYLNLLNFIPKNEPLEMVQLTEQIVNLDTGDQPIAKAFRYKFWYKLVFSAVEWKNGGIRTFGNANAFINMVNDKIIREFDEIYVESINSLEKTNEYLTQKTVFDCQNLNKNKMRQKWYLDFEGKLFSTEPEK